MEDPSPTPPRAPISEMLRQRKIKRQSAPRSRLQHRVTKPKPKSQRRAPRKVVKEALACPYYRYAPEAHPNCRTFSGDELFRVKGHVFRAHLKPEQCENCGHRAGDQWLLAKHRDSKSCIPRGAVALVGEDIKRKAERIHKTTGDVKTWDTLYRVVNDLDEHARVPDSRADVDELRQAVESTCQLPWMLFLNNRLADHIQSVRAEWDRHTSAPIA